MKPIEVSNDYLGSTIPEITTQTATTPLQILRNTDNKYFEVTKIMVSNRSSVNLHLVKLVDADLIDAGEDTYEAETYVKLEFWVLPEDTLTLTQSDFGRILFRYGVAGYHSVSEAAGSGTTVRVVGKEY